MLLIRRKPMFIRKMYIERKDNRNPISCQQRAHPKKVYGLDCCGLERLSLLTTEPESLTPGLHIHFHFSLNVIQICLSCVFTL